MVVIHENHAKLTREGSIGSSVEWNKAVASCCNENNLQEIIKVIKECFHVKAIDCYTHPLMKKKNREITLRGEQQFRGKHVNHSQTGGNRKITVRTAENRSEMGMLATHQLMRTKKWQ